MEPALATRYLIPGSASHSDAASARIVADLLPGDAPALVYLHGMTSTRSGVKSEALLGLARARGLAFARFDFRGHGGSDGALAELTVTHLVEDTLAVLGALGPAPAILVGSSMGGLAAACTAARVPERVVALAILAPALGYLTAMARHASPDFELRRSDEAPVLVSAEALLDARRYDEAVLPTRLTMPVFAAHGSADATVSVGLAEEFLAAVPHCRKEFWWIEGGTHALNEDIAAILARLEHFLVAQRVLAPA